MIRRLGVFAVSFWLSGAALFAFQAGTPNPSDTTGFEPVTSLPPGQQIPAAPYLLWAYGLIWIGVFFYAWSIWKRLGKVEQEMRALEKRRK
jgi:CcmD family protein